MSVEKFEFTAGSPVAHHKEEEGLMLIWAKLDSSVKWVSSPKGLEGIKEGTKLYVREVKNTPCRCGRTHPCLVLNETINGKQLIVYECSNNYLFGLI